MRGEYFIPFRKTDVISMCAAELPADERTAFAGCVRMLANLLHQRFRLHIETLKDAYHPLNPDSDTRHLTRLSRVERQAARERVEEELTELARAANFTPVDPAELERAFTDHSLLKVRMVVDTDAIEKVLFFRRGESTRHEQVRTWFGLRRRMIAFTNFAKVLVYATFKDAEHFPADKLDSLPFRPGSTVVKLFQNVPREDLEMVFPHVKVQMRLIDKLLIGVPAVISGIVVIVTKLFASIGLLVLLIGLWLGLTDRPVTLSQTALVSAGAGLFAFGAYLMRQVTKFKNRKIVFMRTLSENLYFRNLDNDAGVFHHLLDAAEEAEAIETVLGYHLLRSAPAPLTATELDQRIEDWFAQRWDTTVDFDVDDAVAKLRQFGLVREHGEGQLSAVSLAQARDQLDRAWAEVAVDDPRRVADEAAVPALAVDGSASIG